MATTITGTTIDVGPNKLVANSAGNVGIGTASPAKPLDVTGDIRTSTGILFGTDTAAANALDDYEEGTFTPSGTGVNTSSSLGIYTKIGRVCHVQIWIEANGNTAGHLGGLPFLSGIGNVNYLGVGSVGFQNGTVNSIMTTAQTGGFYMYAANNSAGQLTNGQQLHCSLTYITT